MNDNLSLEKFDSSQKNVILHAHNNQLIVTAPPGAGKTFVAIALVDWLVSEHQISSHEILFIAFARTTVAELNRRASQDSGQNLRIMTLDSQVMSILSAQGIELNIADNDPGNFFNRNILELNGLIDACESNVVEYFKQFKHIIVDEAQDFVGDRAALIENIIDLFAPQEIGVTIFGDPCQGIYGFTDDMGGKGESSSDLITRLSNRKDSIWSPKKFDLDGGHRFENEVLARTVISNRKEILKKMDQDALSDYYQRILKETGNCELLEVNSLLEDQISIDVGESRLILFRYRNGALKFSKKLSDQRIQHRLRMGRVPKHLPPWVTLFLRANHEERFFNKSRFLNSWQRIERHPFVVGQITAEEAWSFFKTIYQSAGGTGNSLELALIRASLSKLKVFPIGMAKDDVGSGALIVGTIHGSKGREAARVDISWQVPDTNNDGDNDWQEEGRVLYVALTRASKRVFFLDESDSRGFRSDPTGGSWYNEGKRAKFEIGCSNDLIYLSPKCDSSVRLQNALFEGNMVPSFMCSSFKSENELVYLSYEENEFPVANWSSLNHRLKISFGKIMGSAGRKWKTFSDFTGPPHIGWASEVLSEDDSELNNTDTVTRASGAFFVPIIYGYTAICAALRTH